MATKPPGRKVKHCNPAGQGWVSRLLIALNLPNPASVSRIEIILN
jgi:hypothetical protein